MKDYEYENEMLHRATTLLVNRHGVALDRDGKVEIDGEIFKGSVLHGVFSTGIIVTTDSIRTWINQDDNPSAIEYRRKLIEFLLTRHVTGDWGDLCWEDCLVNEEALRLDERIMSVYNHHGLTFWIITEWNRKTTTVLFPEDY